MRFESLKSAYNKLVDIHNVFSKVQNAIYEINVFNKINQK